MSDLIDRLREATKDYVDCGAHCDLELEAAKEIERLQARVDELEAALRYIDRKIDGDLTGNNATAMIICAREALANSEVAVAVRVGPNSTGITDDMIIERGRE